MSNSNEENSDHCYLGGVIGYSLFRCLHLPRRELVQWELSLLRKRKHIGVLWFLWGAQVTQPLRPAGLPPEQKQYLARGLHAVADIKGADPALLADGAFLQRVAAEAAQLAGATVLFSHAHSFGEGQGIAGVVLLSESHLTFHTWPEHGSACLDAFMCGSCTPEKALSHIAKALRAETVRSQTLPRGD